MEIFLLIINLDIKNEMLVVFNVTFNYISVIRIGGGNWSTRRKPEISFISTELVEKWLTIRDKQEPIPTGDIVFSGY
jgi:hypothetical protein